MNSFYKRAYRGIIVLILVSALGCSKVTSEDAGFIENTKVLEKNENIPFDGYWIKTDTDLRNFKKVYVAPIDVTHLLQLSCSDQ